MTGAAKYTDDLVLPGAWHGKTVRSTIPAGRIRSITLDQGFDWTSVVVVTADDIPEENVVHLIRDDQPVLAGLGREIRHREEPVLQLVGPDRACVEEAARHIRIEYDTVTPLYDLDKATEVYSTIEISKGEVVEDEDVEVVQRTFTVGLQEQLYIEPQGAIAIPEAGGAIRVVGSLQCPYYVHRALKRALKLTDAQAIVVQAGLRRPTG